MTNRTVLKRKYRGYFGTAMERKDGLLYLRWMDNTVVAMISSSCGSRNVGQVKRFSQKEKRNVLVPRPR